ncbi:hypothetical protein ATANTOWER_020598 [Ataeniobius toweri]|uniref:BPTI/Kunitz inhibitor domain-containing protein n=1 Tax=Ataeniobius toweri TaxID=208326 RepID=A0ABU7AQJ5_9TELE|nr:hypothetical protein [Ataeniobius toweri]
MVTRYTRSSLYFILDPQFLPRRSRLLLMKMFRRMFSPLKPVQRTLNTSKLRNQSRLDLLTGPGIRDLLFLVVNPDVVVSRVLADAGQTNKETFQEQTEGQTQTDLLDIIQTPGRGDSQTRELGLDLNARCQLDIDFGFQCTDYVQVWFFDKTIAACLLFWYGGCGGNANRFSTEHECFQTCGVQNPSVRLQTEITIFSKDACLLRQDPGRCQEYTTKWFFDIVQNKCGQFWYGGCEGNANRFQTREECEKLCLTQTR